MDSTLIELIKCYEAFKSKLTFASEEDNLANFTAYLNGEIGLLPPQEIEHELVSWKNFNRQTLMEMTTAFLGKMGRYVDNYARKAMPTTPLTSLEEFTYLIVLLQHKSLTKSAIIQRNAHPISTGTEIIKRLLKKEFILEKPDIGDKRKLQISITEQGKQALFASTETTKSIAIVAMGVLSNTELIQLLSTLKKLDHFHEEIHRKNKQLDLKEILENNKEILNIEN